MRALMYLSGRGGLHWSVSILWNLLVRRERFEVPRPWSPSKVDVLSESMQQTEQLRFFGGEGEGHSRSAVGRCQDPDSDPILSRRSRVAATRTRPTQATGTVLH